MLWLTCGCAVSVLCYYYPLWVDSWIPPEHDSRMGMFISFFIPCLLGAALTSALAYAALWRAACKRGVRSNVLLLIVGSLLLIAAALPGMKLSAVIIRFWRTTPSVPADIEPSRHPPAARMAFPIRIAEACSRHYAMKPAGNFAQLPQEADKQGSRSSSDAERPASTSYFSARQ